MAEIPFAMGAVRPRYERGRFCGVLSAMSINPIDAGVLIDLLSFSVRDAVEARLRSFGGDSL